ncbi:MAG TPA: hypothetical protein VMF89_28300 [Polyangiales bacterium]|nr:hypothetical protein [Polyangiales bacterium]
MRGQIEAQWFAGTVMLLLEIDPMAQSQEENQLLKVADLAKLNAVGALLTHVYYRST